MDSSSLQNPAHVHPRGVVNDLVVATLVLIMLVFEAPDLRVADEYREYLAGLKKRIHAWMIPGLWGNFCGSHR
jgi:hypothetical protein